MNKLKQLFENKNNNILSIYFTAGYPELNNTIPILEELQNSGTDLVELGMPFSDPLADGETIQNSSIKAIKNGMNPDVLFNQYEPIKDKIKMPVIIMGYYNPIYQYGFESFLKKCKQLGISGLIIPDLPVDQYEKYYKNIFQDNDVYMIFLITPQTTDKRIRFIDSLSKSFIYMVSSASITGSTKGISSKQIEYFNRIKNMKLKSPTLIGFGIYNNETFNTACKYANGAIIGSAFIKALNQYNHKNNCISDFINSITNN